MQKNGVKTRSTENTHKYKLKWRSYIDLRAENVIQLLLNEKLYVSLNIRATIGIMPLIAYELEYYSSPTHLGSSHIVLKNDGVGLNVGLVRPL